MTIVGSHLPTLGVALAFAGLSVGDLPLLGGIIVLLAMAGLFAGSEAAFFSLAPHDVTRFGRSGSAMERLIASLLARPRALLIAILFGNLVTHVLLFSIATLFSTKLAARGAPTAMVVGASAAVVVATILFGELVPKTLGVMSPRRFAVVAAPVLAFVRTVIGPFVGPLDVLIPWVGRVVAGSAKDSAFLSPEELRQLMEMQADEGVLARTESDFLQGVVELGDIRVKEMMTPRVDVVSFDLRKGRGVLFEEIRAGTARKGTLPVHEGNVDELVGLVDARDVLLAGDDAELGALVRKPFYVPEAMTAVTLLSELVTRSATMAIVVDEYGGTAGLVTLEDVVEEIVGEINDEWDPKAPAVKRVKEAGTEHFRVLGALSARDAHELFGTAKPGPRDPATLAGMVASTIGRVPEVGDAVVLGGARLHVAKVERGRVRELLVEPLGPDDADDDGESPPGGGDSGVGAGDDDRGPMRTTSLRKARSQLGTTDRALPTVQPKRGRASSRAASGSARAAPSGFTSVPLSPEGDAPDDAPGGVGDGHDGDDDVAGKA